MQDSSCLAKIPVDPTLAAKHVQIGREHRWVAVPPGSMSTLKCQLRDRNGQLMDME